MQISIYYQEEDQYLLDKVKELAKRERRSKSATMLAILEEYFEGNKRVGEILKDMKAINSKELREALSKQKTNQKGRKLGEILLARGNLKEDQLIRALEVQQKQNNGREKLLPE